MLQHQAMLSGGAVKAHDADRGRTGHLHHLLTNSITLCHVDGHTTRPGRCL